MFQDGSRRHLGISKFQIFNVKGLNCVAMPNLVEVNGTVAEIWHFYDVGRFSGGFSPNRWNITIFDFFSCPVLSCTFLFFFFTHRARTVQPIFMLYGSNDVVPPKDGPFWGHDDEGHFFGGKCTPNPPSPKGVWIGVFKPKSQNTKIGILSKLLHRFQPNFAQW